MFWKPIDLLACPAARAACRSAARGCDLLLSRLIVLHTIPPQPSSKERLITLPFVPGGPEASTNGFGKRIPLTSMLRSVIRGSPLLGGSAHRFEGLAQDAQRLVDLAAPTVSGGEMRITLPCRPPLPIRRPRFLVSSNSRAAVAARGWACGRRRSRRRPARAPASGPCRARRRSTAGKNGAAAPRGPRAGACPASDVRGRDPRLSITSSVALAAAQTSGCRRRSRW